jgi:hypothetical protein
VETAVQQVPTRLIKALFNSDRDGRPTLPAWGREEAFAWLRRIIVDFDSLEGHIAFLQELYQEPFQYERPGPLAEGVYRLPLGNGPSRFKHRDLLADERIVAVADDGPGALADRELAGLLLNPVALLDLYRTIDELSPEAWQEAWHEAGKELVAATKLVAATSTAPPAQAEPLLKIPSRRNRAYAWAGQASAIAASLLLGVAIGSRALHDSGQAAGRSDWSAAATYQAKGTRGDQESNRIEIRSKLDGFATIIMLSPGGGLKVTPGVGGELIRVKPGIPVESPPLPPSSKNLTVALIVVTSTPADAEVRRLLRERKFSPEEADQLRALLETKLREVNYRDLAFTRVDILPDPE